MLEDGRMQHRVGRCAEKVARHLQVAEVFDVAAQAETGRLVQLAERLLVGCSSFSTMAAERARTGRPLHALASNMRQLPYHRRSQTESKDDLMPNLSLRGLAPDALAALKATALKENASVNSVLLRLIDRALGRTSEWTGPVRHSDLDALAGSWKRGETEELEEATRHFRSVDASLWK